MNILAFDTSLDKTYISLSGNFGVKEKVIETDEKNYHSAYLISGLKEITEENGIELKNLDLIAINKGPGSFTGIRVGMTVARTIAKELNLNTIGVSSLDILFEAYKNVNPVVILDARRNQFYVKHNGEIILVNYDEIANYVTGDAVVCDASSFSRLLNPEKPLLKPEIKIINFEENKVNLSLALLQLANQEFSANSKAKNYTWNNLKPLYIQAPPVFMKA